jgi:hypothetical protein
MAGLLISGLLAGTGQAWAEAARQLGLEYQAGGLLQPGRIRGVHRGVRVAVDAVRRGGGRNDRSLTRYRVWFPVPLGLGLHVSREGLLSRLGKLMGLEDVRTGDDRFDAALMVRGADADAVRRFLTPDRRLRIELLVRTLGDVRIDDDGIAVERRGVERRIETIVGTVRELALAANALLGPAAAPADAAMKAQTRPGKHRAKQRRAGPAAEAAPRAPAQAAPPGTSAPAATPRASTPRAPATSAPAATPRGSTPRAPATSAPAATPRGSTLPTPAASASGPEVPAAPSGPSAATVCQNLFGSDVTSLDASRRFDDVYKGAQVAWSGVLEWVDTTSADLILEEGAGARGVLRICEPTSGLTGGGAVRAFVRLAGATADDLRARVGQKVRFQGRLDGCDAFGRNLYVVDGRLRD